MGILGFKRGISMKVLSTAAVAVLAGFGTRTASAAPLGTLQDLINDGATGITIGNYQFYGFSYIGIPPDGPNPAPTASQITVSAPDNVATIGLDFSAGWQSAEGFNQESQIFYSVHALNDAPMQFISSVTVNFNGTAPIPGAATAATETDTLKDSQGNVIASVTLKDDGMTSTDFGQTLPINPGLRDVQIEKDISVTSSQDGGLSTISVSDNTIATPVGSSPEPASIGLFAVAGLGLLRRRRA